VTTDQGHLAHGGSAADLELLDRDFAPPRAKQQLAML
jgi:hypothetical protein